AIYLWNRVMNKPDQASSPRQCPICLGAISGPNARLGLLLNCDHVFCEECIVSWLERDRRCPVCRASNEQLFVWRRRITDPEEANTQSGQAKEHRKREPETGGHDRVEPDAS